MAGQWESVGGVFWKAPPVLVLNEERSFLPLIILLVFAAAVSLSLWVRIAKGRREQGLAWGLRKYLTEIGGAVTAIYLAGATALIWGRVGSLGSMPLNEVGDFLAGAFGPVAFLWLVLGFLQQGDELRQGTEALMLQAQELRNSVEQQSIMAAAATKQIKAQEETLGLHLKERDRALRANFSVGTGSSGSGRRPGIPMNRLMFTNDGNTAFKAMVSLDAPFLDAQQVLLGTVKGAERKEVQFDLTPTTGPLDGGAQINYVDSDGNQRSESFTFRVVSSRAVFNKCD